MDKHERWFDKFEGIIVNGVKMSDLVMFMEDSNRLKTVESDLSKSRASNDSLRERIALLEKSLTDAHADRVKAEDGREWARNELLERNRQLNDSEMYLAHERDRVRLLQSALKDAVERAVAAENALRSLKDSVSIVNNVLDNIDTAS